MNIVYLITNIITMSVLIQIKMDLNHDNPDVIYFNKFSKLN